MHAVVHGADGGLIQSRAGQQGLRRATSGDSPARGNVLWLSKRWCRTLLTWHSSEFDVRSADGSGNRGTLYVRPKAAKRDTFQKSGGLVVRGVAHG